MCLVLPQKISKALDITWIFHNWNGEMYHLCTHVGKTNANKNPANEKFIKNQNQILDTLVKMMEKVSWFLDLIWVKYELWKIGKYLDETWTKVRHGKST